MDVLVTQLESQRTPEQSLPHHRESAGLACGPRDRFSLAWARLPVTLASLAEGWTQISIADLGESFCTDATGHHR